MAFRQPLDLQYWFVNVLSGNLVIFYFISLIAIAGLSAKFRMPTQLYLPLVLIYTFILASVSDIGQSGLVQGTIFLAVMFLGLALYPLLRRTFQ